VGGPAVVAVTTKEEEFWWLLHPPGFAILRGATENQLAQLIQIQYVVNLEHQTLPRLTFAAIKRIKCLS
jgi:hypothetical protein